MDLYIKAGPDGTSVGDCPFAHYVRAVIAFKGLHCTVHPCTKDTKPQWLVEKHAGKMPCLVNGDDIITESSDIAVYLDKTHPEPPLASGPQVDQISQQISGFFPAMARFVKSVEHSQELEDKLLVELETLDNLVAESKGAYLCGDQVSLADLAIAPKLFHLKTTLEEFSSDTFEKVKKFQNLSKYIETMLAENCVSSCSYPKETVLWGWGQARSK